MPAPIPPAELEARIDAALDGAVPAGEDLAAELRCWVDYLNRCTQKLGLLLDRLPDEDRPAGA